MKKGKITRRVVALASASALALTIASAFNPARAADAYKVGVSMDLTGPISFNGKIAAAGLETYVNRINDTGGVNGRKIDLSVADDASDLAKGKANERRFADDGALAIFGFILSTVSAGVAPQAIKDKVPLVALGGLRELLAPPNPYYFSYELQAAKLSNRILGYIALRAKADKIATPRVAVLVVDVPSNREVAQQAVEEIKKRGWVLAGEPQYVPVSPTNVTAQAAAIKAANPDYVLMSHNDTGALVVVRGFRSQGVTVPIINQWAGSADATLERLGDGYIAFRTFTSPTDDSVPAIAAVRADGQKYGFAAQMTSPYFTQGYVAGMILEKALKSCGACASGEDFAKAMNAVGEIDTKGLSGPARISAQSHEFIETVRFYTWDAAAKKAKPISDWVGPDSFAK